ncbi:MAG: 2-oxoacid:acceptor oxidoreductase family protein [Sulfolobales archaeon]
MSRFEIRWHGRGGQGIVTAADLTATAAIKLGYYAQSIPTFGTERRGAPVIAYNRIDRQQIFERSPVVEPDAVVVADPHLLINPKPLSAGLKSGGYLIVNTAKTAEEIRNIFKRNDVKIAVINATKLAMDVLKAPIVNTAMVGALVSATKVLTVESLIDAVKDRFPARLVEPNVQLIKQAYESVKVE